MNNPFQIMQMLRNPQVTVQQISSNPQIMNNPVFHNAFEMAKSGKSKELETLVRNVAKEKNVDIDTLRKQIGI